MTLKTQKAEDFEAYRVQRNEVVRRIRTAKQVYLDDQISRFPAFMAENQPRKAFETLKRVLTSASKKWAAAAASRPSVSPKDLKEHYSALFKRRGEKVEVADFASLKHDRDLTMDELIKAKSKLKSGKSPGHNGLRSELLKWGGSLLDGHMLNLFNSCWNGSKKIPREWIDAEVVSIYKRKGSAGDANSYRGIFLLDTIGKLYAGIICQRLEKHLINPLSPTQYGFREGYSSEQAILAIRRCIQLSLNENKPIVLIFVDLRKAFDSIPTQTIIKRLIDLNCSRNLVQSVSELLDSPIGRLRGSKESFIMERGVRQGSKEGPLLFNLTFQLVLEEVYDLAHQMGINLVTTSGEKWRLGHVEYADDLCLITNAIYGNSNR